MEARPTPDQPVMSTPTAVTDQTLTVPARDGYSLGVTHYPSATGVQNRGTILFNSANAVPQTFYSACARFFASAGFDVYTYDYRGIGRSAPETLRGFDADVQTWAKQDISAIVDAVKHRHPNQSLTYFAHSIGGQLMGLVASAHLIDRAVFVSCQFGYWKLQGGREKHRTWLFTNLVFPVLARAYGYLPWSRFAAGEDLPKGAALQWARWCRSKNYLFDDRSLSDLDGYERFDKPLLAYHITDDDWGTKDAVEAMTQRYSSAQVEHRNVDPSDYGYKGIGHFGFFKRGREELWSNAQQWIERH